MQKLPPATKAARETLGAFIREARRELRCSQEDFAEKCGVHRNYVGRIERAELSMSFDNLVAVAAALDLTPSGMLKRAGL